MSYQCIYKLRTLFPNLINTLNRTVSFPKYSKETIWKSATVVCQTWNQESAHITRQWQNQNPQLKQEYVTVSANQIGP